MPPARDSVIVAHNGSVIGCWANIKFCCEDGHWRGSVLGWRRGDNPRKTFSILFIMKNIFQLIQIINNFDLGSILKTIAFPFVFVFVCYSMFWSFLTEIDFELPEFVTVKPFQSPLITINEELQSVTVKNLRKIQSFPKSYKKQDIINALLITL